ncbi:hypothetical protein Tco_1085819 [Tanacetum coccineum]
MFHELGEVNPTHAYYNSSCTIKDTEDPSWSTSFKTRRTQKTSSALEALWKTLFVLYLYLIGTLSKRDIQYVLKQWVQRLRRDGVLDGAFGGVGDEEVVVGEGVVVISSSLEMLTNSCLGRIMVSLIFLEGFEEEAFVEFMVDFG